LGGCGARRGSRSGGADAAGIPNGTLAKRAQILTLLCEGVRCGLGSKIHWAGERKRKAMLPTSLISAAIGALLFIVAMGRSGAEPLPAGIGHCSRTAIAWIGTRLEDGQTGRPIPGSGSAVKFAHGGYQVSYDTVPQITTSRIGDPVTMCLVSIPRNCPPGDNRWRVYQTINLRTGQSWQLPDSQHSCGGA
jgi:hypothetical protein